MKDIFVTTYRGFSNVNGQIGLTDCINDIRTGKYMISVEKIALLVAQGKTEEANNVKKQLPLLTVTANYRERRLAESISRYNDVQTIDIDDLTKEQVTELRPVLEADANMLAFFLTPKRHGYKLIVYLQTSLAVQLRRATLGVEEIAYEALEHYHGQMYELSRAYYEKLLGVKVDTSGRDIGRGMFTSFDEQAYLNEELLQRMVVPEIRILPPLPKVKKVAGRMWESEVTGNVDVNIGDVEPWEKMEYQKAVNAARRLLRFEEGNRDTFLFTLGSKCYKRGIRKESVLLLVKRDYSMPGLDVETPVHNAYKYTDKTDAKEQEKSKDKRPIVEQVIDFLDEHYSIRRNVILERLEFADYSEGTQGSEPRYRLMRNRDFNSVFTSMQLTGIKCFQTVMRAVIDSNYALNYNPFVDYFSNRTPWDGKTDYIGQLADTVKTKDREFWQQSFKHWLVGLVAGALNDEVANHLVLILFSKQGKGKSTWIRNLLPPQLKGYYRNGMISTENKDHSLLMSSHLLINMEEFEGMKNGDIAGLKRMVTQETITERKTYDPNMETYMRHASFIGSTNEQCFLQDFGGARRFVCSVATDIDYHTPVNYEGVYGQAFYLLNNGYRYWYEGEEIELLNRRNEQFRMKDPVEEMLYVFYRQATTGDTEVKWKPAAAILSTIAAHGRILMNKQTQQHLTKVLERDGFNPRISVHGVTEYEVVQFSMEEVERGFRKEANVLAF